MCGSVPLNSDVIKMVSVSQKRNPETNVRNVCFQRLAGNLVHLSNFEKDT